MSFRIDDSTLANFRAKYSWLHPLVFQRSLERAVSALDLFEILESAPKDPPFSWDEGARSWRRDEDVRGVESMKAMLKRK